MEFRRFVTSWNLKNFEGLRGISKGCEHFRLFGQLHDRISKVFGLLDEISKGFVLQLLDERILKVPAPFERTLKVPSRLSFERTSKVPDFHLEELRRPRLPFERTSKVPGSHLAHFEDPGISCQTFRK
ncbi:unnamed protein product [Rhizophagus irregularis]|nr:unnamed protein product [Rhizophagus irregularis]